MHTFVCYRRETLNDLPLQITWKSYASSCKERGVFLASGPPVVGIIIAHLSHSWDFQNYMRRPHPTKLCTCGLRAGLSTILRAKKKDISFVNVPDVHACETLEHSELPDWEDSASQNVTKIQFEVKELIDEEMGSVISIILSFPPKSSVNAERKKKKKPTGISVCSC